MRISGCCWLSVFLELSAAVSPLKQPLFSTDRLQGLRNRTKALFFHGFDNYIDQALPLDELRPLSCEGVGADPDELHFGRNDVMGNFSLTLIDALDMLPILDEQPLFEKYTAWVGANVSFDIPSTVKVFEVNIRVIGGLLSAHMYASTPSLGHAIPGYDGHLLTQAHDLALRLLPSFSSATGIPFPRVHLQRGVVPIDGNFYTETTSAAAGTLLLEFTLLSRLTGDGYFEKKALDAFFQVWKRRSSLDLVGMSLDVESGEWTEPYTNVGASVDSFYEYALKYALLFDNCDVYRVWEEASMAVEDHLADGYWVHHVVDIDSGHPIAFWIDALGAFWSGLLVLAGRLSEAVVSHIIYYKLWNNYAGIPDRWSWAWPNRNSVVLEWYLLRPEFLESTYYLYQSTRDPFYLQVGEAALTDLERINVVPCGVCATQDVRTGELSDRMDSFFLSETLKYLYLLFTPDHPLNKYSGNMVFSTEAHPFWNDPSILAASSASQFGLNFPPVEQRSSRLRRKSRVKTADLPKRNTALSAFNNGTCPSAPSDIGTILSWNRFYMLDRVIPFKKPSWLYRKQDIEFMNDFYDIYVSDTAMCQ